MATKEDALALAAIQKIVEHSDMNKLQPELILADGVEIYYRAIKSVRNAGIWMVDIEVIGFIITIITALSNQDYLNPFVWIGISLVALLVSGSLALKNYYFKVTPVASLIILLVIVPIGAFAVPYIFIPFMALPVISALFKWSTYKSWYDDEKKYLIKKYVQKK